MIEPTTSITAGSIAAALSGITLALLGVDYYALLWGLVGAVLALGQAAPMTRGRAVAYVVLSALVGAALGHALISFTGSISRPMLILGSLVGGAGAQIIIAALIKAVVTRVEKTGGGA